MAAYELWVKPPEAEPELVGRVVAPSFKVACWLFTLESTLQDLCEKIEQGINVEDEPAFGSITYNPIINMSSLSGIEVYYRTKEEALKHQHNG
jgi:hypothetical protein